MNNFSYNAPTTIFFGKGDVKDIASEIIKYSNRILLAYGGGSIKKNGVYDSVVKILEDNNIFYKELPGIQSNPKVESAREGIKLCREHNLGFILAVGGGSVIDCSKAVAAGVKYKGDVWDFYEYTAQINDALPLGAVLTLAATGTEMNGNSVLSDMTQNKKVGVGSEHLRPKFSVLDPEYTYSVNRYYTAAGVVDIMSHIFEQYFSPIGGTYVLDRMAESLLKTVIHYGKTVLDEPGNYEARSNIMWAGTHALNGILSTGKPGDWATHGIEHEVSAIYDVAHGAGLAAITPYWMDYVLNEETKERFINLAKNVFNLSGDDSIETAIKGIRAVKDYFASLDMPISLKPLVNNKDNIEIMAKAAVRFGSPGGLKKLSKDDIVTILTNSFEEKLR